MRTRKSKPASVSVTARKQRDTDFALQRRDRPRRGRLRHVQLTTDRGKASLAGDPSEQPQREEVVTHSEDG
jgi:hypothetical protein